MHETEAVEFFKVLAELTDVNVSAINTFPCHGPQISYGVSVTEVLLDYRPFIMLFPCAMCLFI